MLTLSVQSSAEVFVLLEVVHALFVSIGLGLRALSASRSLVCAIDRSLELVRLVLLHAGLDTLKLAADIVVETILDLLLGLDRIVVKVANRILPPDRAGRAILIVVIITAVIAAESDTTGC